MTKFWGKVLQDCIVPAHKQDFEEFNKLKSHAVVKVEIKQPRSRKHDGLFFAAIKEAFDNWPETHEDQFENSEHLRAWLLCKAGYRESVVCGTTEQLAGSLTRAFKDNKWPFLRDTQEGTAVITAKSIAWSKIDKPLFNEISQRVSDVLATEFGKSLDDIKVELEKRDAA